MGEIAGGIASGMFHEIRENPEVVMLVTINRKIAGFVKHSVLFQAEKAEIISWRVWAGRMIEGK